MSTPSRFTGFRREGVNFFKELALRQDRDWFKAHKATFGELWEQPLTALLAELQPAIARQYRSLGLEKPKVFRIYRDVRFSKDKSPFKTNVAAVFATRGGMETGAPAALYLHFGLSDEVGAGHWMLPPDRLAALRRLATAPKTGPELHKRVAALQGRGFRADAMEKLKRVPAGFDAQHPNAELLKLKGLGILFPKIPPKLRFSKGLAKWLGDRSAEVAPFVTWLHAKLS